MRRTIPALFALATVAMLTTSAMSQRPGGPGGPGGRGPGNFDGPPPNPVIEALDADGDHEISAQEIDGAVAALKKLDTNKDGKLTLDELRPFRGPGRGGPGGPGGGERERDGDRGGRGGVGDGSAFVDRIFSFDADKDGKVSKTELPERMHGIFDRQDANSDGVLDIQELERMVERFGRDREGGPGRGGPGRSGGFGGPPRPERFVEHALTFDEDKDGKLNRDELAKMAEGFVRRGPPGGGRPGGDRGGRPERPERPE